MNAARKTFIAAVALAALAAGIVLGQRGIGGDRANQAAGAVGAGATTLLLAQTYPDAHGKEQALSQYRGKKLLLNFWASWCAPCIEEIPEFSRVQNEVGAARVQFIGLGVDNADNIAAFSRKNPASYPLIVVGAGGTELTRMFGNATGGLPYTVLIDESGRVVKRHAGRLSEAELRSWLASAS